MPRKKVETVEDNHAVESCNFTSWIPIIFQFFNESEVLNISKALKTSFDGFDVRSLHKVPKPLLRKKTLEKISKTPSPEKMFRVLYQQLFRYVKQTTNTEALIWKMTQDGASQGIILSVIMLERPEYFKEIEHKVKENIAQKRLPLHEIIIVPSLEDQVKLQFPIYLDKALVQISINDLFNQFELLSNDDLLGKLKEKIYVEIVGTYLSIAAKFDEWKKWDHSDRDAFLKLVMIDAINLISQLHKQASSMNEQIQGLNLRIDSLTNRNRENEHLIKELNAKNFDIKNELNFQQEYYNNLIEEHLQKALEAERKTVKTDFEHLIDDVKIKVIIFGERPQLLAYLNDEIVINLLNIDEFKIKLATQIELLSEHIWFIDSGNCSSSDMFQLEQAFRQHKVPFRFISGTDLQLIRKIIFYLEGDIIYETN